MAPKPYSEKSSHPADSSNDDTSGIPIQILPETPSPENVSGATTPSPSPQEQVPVETFVDNAVYQESSRIPDLVTPCYPTPGDIMPYDHSLPDFIRQITNQPNLANLQSLRMRVISTLISLHRMASYLPNLRVLDLEGSILNSLRDIGCSLKNLQILKVGRCQLDSLDGTFGLSSLRELYAQKNFINDVSPCSNLPHIRHIDVSGNRIRNISYAGFLSVCTKLKSIIFSGNPAAEAEDYRKHVRRILPQIETLDGIPFTNEDNQERKESELIENYCEGADGSSTESPDLVWVSPSDRKSNLIESEELFLLNKKYKQEKNLASQDQADAVEYDVTETKTNFQLQVDFQTLNLYQNQAKADADSRNLNLKQKCASIQKFDKDMENRSKKSNLQCNGDSDFSQSEADRPSSPSTSASANWEFRSLEKESGRPSTAAELSDEARAEELKRGVIKKRPSSATLISRREEQTMAQNSGLTKLTVGMPLCGNLTAALRNRKKIRNAWTDISGKTQNTMEESMEKLEVDVNGSGDNLDADSVTNEDDLIGEDVLLSSQKWRETFRRFRSNNRARWEEEEQEESGLSTEKK